jgi:hypothetical protein
MSFLRQGEIYHFDEGAIPLDRPPLIETMSFQPAIPWQVALPQSLLPLHQPAPILKEIAFAVQFNSSERRTVS